MDRISRHSQVVEGVGLVASGFCLCYLQMTWSCWPPQTVTSSCPGDGLQASVWWQEWESTPINVRPWFSAGEWWITNSRSDKICFHKWKSSSTLGWGWNGVGDWRIGAASAVMWTLKQSVVGKRKLNQKANLSIYRSIYVPTLIYGHELWVMTERMRSQIRGFGHLDGMPPGCLPVEVFQAGPSRRRPRGSPRTCWTDYISRLAPCLDCCPCNPDPVKHKKNENEMKKTMEIRFKSYRVITLYLLAKTHPSPLAIIIIADLKMPTLSEDFNF